MFKFPDPLLDEVRLAKHGETIDFTAVHKFTKDEASLDLFLDFIFMPCTPVFSDAAGCYVPLGHGSIPASRTGAVPDMTGTAI